MSSSIIPRGFECTAHPIFFQYKSRPVNRVLSFKDVNVSNPDPDEHQLDVAEETELSLNLPIVCPVCLDNFSGDVVTVLACRHSFCRDCLLGWYRAQLNYGKFCCPICKSEDETFLEPCMSSDVFPAGYNLKRVVENSTSSDYATLDILKAVYVNKLIHERIRQSLVTRKKKRSRRHAN